MPKPKKPIYARQTRPSALVNACELYARTLFRRDATKVQLAESRAHEVALRTALAAAEQATAQAVVELSALEATLLEAGRFIQSFDARLLPQRIRAVRTTRGRYGPAGGLTGAILHLLAQAPPAGMHFRALRDAVIDAVGLSLPTQAAIYVWSENSLRHALKHLRNQGDVVRVDDSPRVRGGVWRLAGDSIPCSLETLKAEFGAKYEASGPGSAAPPSDA